MVPRFDGQDADEFARDRILKEELTEFTSRAGHDLLGPLNQAASLLALFVKRYKTELNAEADVVLEHLGNAAVRMDTVFAGCRRYLNIANQPLKYRAIDLRAALSSALAILDPEVRASGATITVDPLPAVRGDADKITAAFEMLVDNAIKFQRPAEAPQIHISASRQGDDILIAVADNGIGIDPQYSQEVLLPFRCLNGRRYPGAGLGLATAKLIVRLHGGSIRIDPAQESGTKVVMTLPGPGGLVALAGISKVPVHADNELADWLLCACGRDV